MNTGAPADWTPPAGWREVESAREGIRVFAPPPEGGAEEARRTWQCPGCGAPVAFDESQGALACPYCGHREEAAGRAVGRGAEASEFTVEALDAFRRGGLGVERRELHCQTCGAALAVEEGVLATTCPFCASPSVDVRAATHQALRPGFVVPFRVDRERTARAAREWLGKGWMHPASLADMARVDHFTGIYVPWWTFSADLDCSWEAEVGHEHTESYWDSATKSRRTRTVVHWEWKRGTVHLDLDDQLVPGTARASALLLGRIADFDLGGLSEYTPAFLAGWQALAYDVDLPAAWEKGRAAMRERGRVACTADTGSAHVRNFSMTADFREETWRYALLPVWISAYRFDGRVWQVLVNGQTGTVGGQKPVAWWKIWTAIALMQAPAVLLALVGLPLLLVGVGLIPLAIAFFLLILGIVGALWLHGVAVAAEVA